jgi:hypothetical protein
MSIPLELRPSSPTLLPEGGGRYPIATDKLFSPKKTGHRSFALEGPVAGFWKLVREC